MNEHDIKVLFRKQKTFFQSGVTYDIKFIINTLKKLRNLVLVNEDKILKALNQDLNKSSIEAFTSEIGYVIKEIDLLTQKLPKWNKSVKVRTKLINQPGSSSYIYEPFGSVLIISPWNYPFGLNFTPLVSAVAAGNCIITKPSEISENTSNLIYELITRNFGEEYIAAVQGGKETTQLLINENTDYVFFTGSTSTGKAIMKSCADHLIPLTLELGGKNPCIVNDDADLDVSAKRIVWGKFFNAGQTCVAPDYLLVHENIRDSFLSKLKETINQFYYSTPGELGKFTRIINEKHFSRIKSLIENQKIFIGGETDKERLFISPTIVLEPDKNSEIMKEEIFGPVLPVVFFNNFEAVLSELSEQKEPLCIYLFSRNRKLIDRIKYRTKTGAVCINGTLNILMPGELPFGGVGASGFGRYHGKAGFETFSRKKSILTKSFIADQSYIYPPSETDLKIVKKAVKFLY